MSTVDSKTSNINGVPFIDFAGFGDGTSEAASSIGRQFFAACRDVGFAYLINTGVSQGAVDEIFEWSRKFFALSLEEKMSALRPKEPRWNRGYNGIGREQISQHEYDPSRPAAIRASSLDNKESFDYGNPAPTARLPNIFPPAAVLPGFEAQCLRFFHTARTLQLKVLRALALGFDSPEVDPEFFDRFHTEAANRVRLLHYPTSPSPSPSSSNANGNNNGRRSRCNTHTDFGTCTLLFQDPRDAHGGLEIEDPHAPGTFVSVPPVKGAVVFNIADFLMRWSNGVLRSTMHRVRAPEAGEGKERFSIPVFIGADAHATIDCIAGCYDPADPSSKKYAPITASEYLDMRMSTNY